jgi:SWI/SNF-related matrix-associated actin-dependent regulator 1 of chromatin subfamily A
MEAALRDGDAAAADAVDDAEAAAADAVAVTDMLRTAVAVRDADIAHLRDDIVGATAEAAAAASTVAALQREVENARTRLAAVETTVAATATSTTTAMTTTTATIESDPARADGGGDTATTADAASTAAAAAAAAVAAAATLTRQVRARDARISMLTTAVEDASAAAAMQTQRHVGKAATAVSFPLRRIFVFMCSLLCGFVCM